MLAAGFACTKDGVRITVGARPKKAMLLTVPEDTAAKIREGVCSEEEIARIAASLAKEVPTESNLRAGKEYRSHLAEVLICRGLGTLQERGPKE